MSGALTFLDQVFCRLQSRGYSTDWNINQLTDALVRAMQGPSSPTVLSSVAVEVTDLTTISVPDHIMIHEMLKRGYAVMKLPENGKLDALG